MSAQLIKQLKEARARLWAEGDALLNKAEREKRDLTAAEDTQWRKIGDDLRAIDSRVDDLQDFQTRAAEMDKTFSDILGRPAQRGAQPLNPGDAAVLDQFRAAVLERNPAPIMLVDDAPRSYYSPAIERRDLLTTAPASFGPVSFYNRIIETMFDSSAVLDAGATLITTSSGEDLRVPRATAIGTAGIVAEANPIPESDPTLGIVTLKAYKYGLLAQVSTEMVQDTTINLGEYLAREIGTAIGLSLGAHLISGTGTGQPRGVLADATVGVTAPTGCATSLGTQATAGQGTDLLNSLYGSLAEPYSRAKAAGFLARNSTMTAIRNLKANTGELIGTQFIADSPAPFYADAFVPAMAANAKSVLFGDWSRYFVRMVNGIRVERSDDYAFANDLVTFRVLLRADGALIDPSAIKYLANSAT